MGDGLSIADAMALAKDGDGNWGNNGFIWILFLFFLMAWGNGGMFGNRGMDAAQGALTRAEMYDGFNNQEIVGKLDALSNGLCQSTYAINNGINGLGMNMMSGFNGVDKSMCQIGHQIDSCCCQTGRAIESVKYENERNACNIIDAVNASSQRIIDHLTQNEIDNLRTQLQSANLQLSNNSQTANLIATLRPFPQPAYITCSPYTSASSGCCQAFCGVA